MLANDKILENRSEKMDNFSSAIKNQLSFNKMLETQLALLATINRIHKLLTFSAPATP